jgi:carbon-monoxide dehydrogenase large subunit
MTDNAVQHRLIGARVNRVEDERYLRGEGQYIADITLPGMLHMAFLRSTHAHATIKQIDTDKAKLIPGVIGVWTGAEIKDKANPLYSKMPIEEMRLSEQPMMAYDKVRFVGEAVAVVVAVNRYIAEDAVDEIEVEYDALPVVSSAEKAIEPDSIKVQEQLEDNIILHRKVSHGNVEENLAKAELVLSQRFEHNRYMAAPMETRGCIADYARSDQFLTLRSSTQAPHWFRTLLATILNYPEHRLRIIAPDVGGGFGQKVTLYPEEVVACVLAIILKKPVKWIEDRRENLLAANHAKEQLHEIKMGFSKDGRILAIHDKIIGDSGAYTCLPFTMLVEAMSAAGVLPGQYVVQDVSYEFFAVLTNKSPVGAYRGIGWTGMYAARESLMEEAARKLGIDPIEIRKINMVQPNQFPYRNVMGLDFDSGSYVESMDKIMELVNYPVFRKKQEELRKQNKYIGVGFCPFNEPTGMATELARAHGFPISVHDAVSVNIDPSGKATVTLGLTSQGQGHETTFAQVTADQLGIPMEDVRVVAGDSFSTAYGMGAWASRSAVIGTGAIMRAAQDVKEKLLSIAAYMLETRSEDLDLVNGSFQIKGIPEPKLKLSDVAAVAYFVPEMRPEALDPVLESKRNYDPPSTYSNGVHAAIVEIDIETGKLKVTDFYAVEDCGTVINPKIVEGQMCGAVAQGIGGAVYENLVYDEQGQLLTASLMDYLLPSTTEVPNIVVAHIETPSPYTLGGVKGMGESGMIASPGAILNAANDALSPFGVYMERLPLTPEHIINAIATMKP